jgi:hypothetical protein
VGIFLLHEYHFTEIKKRNNIVRTAFCAGIT